MTKAEVLALCENEAQVQVVENCYTAAERLHNETVFATMADEASIKDLLVTKERAYAAKQEAAAKKQAVIKAISKARDNGATDEQIVAAIEGIYKEKVLAEKREKLAKLQAEIAELEA